MQYALVNNIKTLPAKGLTGTCLGCTKEVIAKCTKLVKFFKTSHQAGKKLKMSIINDSVKGENLKTYIKTRWTTA